MLVASRPSWLWLAFAWVLLAACNGPGGGWDVGNADAADDLARTGDGADTVVDTPELVCSQLSMIYDCDASFSLCFPFNPAGDRGPCTSHGEFCENLWNCTGHDGAAWAGQLDWDCNCRQAADGAWRWACEVLRTCPFGSRDAAE